MPLTRREFLGGAVALGAGWTLLPRFARAAGPTGGGEWLAGDLHCHTVYSHDVWGGPGDENTEPLPDAYTFGWTAAEQIRNAELRSLDFLAVTDHDDVRWIDDGTFAGYRGPVLLIPGYEHSLRYGHAGCLGVTRRFDKPAEPDTPDDSFAGTLRDAVHAEGGTFILNHPFYGSGWRYTPAVRPDSIEVWNIGWAYRKPLFPGVSTSENYKSLPWWENEFLTFGPMPATGGSDNHWRSTVAVQGVGQPTTWVYAAERTWPAVLEAIRAGRTTVSSEPPGMAGPRLFLTARSGSDEWIVGDTVPATASAPTIAACVQNAPGHHMRLVVDGVAQTPVPVTGIDFEHSSTLRPSNRVRAEVYLDSANDGYWMGALTSPIYFE